jgi:truncated hemoglobin YjbI
MESEGIWGHSGFCPVLLVCLHFFNQIQANNAILQYFMIKINTFLGRVVAFFTEWWSGPTSADRQGQNTGHYFAIGSE